MYIQIKLLHNKKYKMHYSSPLNIVVLLSLFFQVVADLTGFDIIQLLNPENPLLEARISEISPIQAML